MRQGAWRAGAGGPASPSRRPAQPHRRGRRASRSSDLFAEGPRTPRPPPRPDVSIAVDKVPAVDPLTPPR